MDANGNQPSQFLQFLQPAHSRIPSPCRLLSRWGNSRQVDPNGDGGLNLRAPQLRWKTPHLTPGKAHGQPEQGFSFVALGHRGAERSSLVWGTRHRKAYTHLSARNKGEAPGRGNSHGSSGVGDKAEAPVRGPRLPVGVGVGPRGVLPNEQTGSAIGSGPDAGSAQKWGAFTGSD